MWVVYSPSRFSYMGWTLAAQGGMKPCHTLQLFSCPLDAAELAKAVRDGEVRPASTAPVASTAATTTADYW